jgi:hypothetical protein
MPARESGLYNIFVTFSWFCCTCAKSTVAQCSGTCSMFILCSVTFLFVSIYKPLCLCAAMYVGLAC